MTSTDKELHINLLTTMLKIRLFEERIIDLYPEQEMKCPVHLCIGQEAIAAGVCELLEKDDYVFSNHRGHGHTVAKGADMGALMAEFYGKVDGCSKGKGGSMHLIDMERGLPGTSAIVGGGIPMGVGAALASSIKGDGRVTVIFFGDGAADEGVLYESMNFAALKKLPVLFFCENNSYATNSHQSARHPTCDIVGTAAGYNMPGLCVDGNDVAGVYDTTREALGRIRDGGGPAMIEAPTYRWKGHVGPEADFAKGCRPEEELIEWVERCPIKVFKKKLQDDGTLTKAEIEDIEAAINSEIDDAVKFAKESPYPSTDELLSNVYYEAPEDQDV